MLNQPKSKKSSNARKKRTAKVFPAEPKDLVTEKKKTSRFPPEVTVDQLYLFRKKKTPAILKVDDHLRLLEGSFKQIKSEYQRRFCSFNLLDSTEKLHETPTWVTGELESKPENNEKVLKEAESSNKVEIDKMDVKLNQEVTTPEVFGRRRKPHPCRRRTNLKMEGEFFATTEQAEKFVEFLLSKRAELLRTPTTLKMEGEMEKISEMKEKYVPLSFSERPHLCRRSTFLHMEGELDTMTENREKYHPFDHWFRPGLAKHDSNLHLEGILEMLPEYKDVFVEYKIDRPLPIFPINNLKAEGLLDSVTESGQKFIEHQVHPVIPFLRGVNYGRPLTLGDDHTANKAEYTEKYVRHPRADKVTRLRPTGQLIKSEGPMEILTENMENYVEKPTSKTERRRIANNLLLEGNMDLNPEYRNAYVDFSEEEKSKVRRTRRRSTSHPATILKSEGKMNVSPEYKSSYVEFPRQRPVVRRPDSHLRSEGDLSTMTEKRAQFVEHPRGVKLRPLKRDTELKIEGNFECQPEYRKAYIDYLIRERKERIPRPLDNIGTIPKRVFEELTPSLPNVNAPLIDHQHQESSSLPEEAKSQLPTLELKKNDNDKQLMEKIESDFFGPKIKPTTSRSSTNITNLPKIRAKRVDTVKKSALNSKQEELDASLRKARSKRKFANRQVVENLAYTPASSPLPRILKNVSKEKWKDGEKDRGKASFVIVEKNNNNVKFSNRNDIYKEARWMPSWYAKDSV